MKSFSMFPDLDKSDVTETVHEAVREIIDRLLAELTAAYKNVEKEYTAYREFSSSLASDFHCELIFYNTDCP